MILKEQVFHQAMLLSGDLDPRKQALLRVLCGATIASLSSRLRDGIRPEDCQTEFVTAASLFALAALEEMEEGVQIEEFKAGDLTVKQGSVSREAASRSLERQAEMVIRPFLKDRFSFMGV